MAPPGAPGWRCRGRPIASLIWSLLVLTGCQSISGLPRDDKASGETANVVIEQGSIRSATGCDLDYVVHRPHSGQTQVRVVLAHGFMRSKERMAGLATRLAGRGIPTATLDFCNMRLWDGAHRQNGDDMRLLARRVGVPRVLYAGFSAGGLAALIAASLDPDAVGVLALDLVERSELGVRAAAELYKPIFGLVGEPAQCNAYNNGLEVYMAAPQAQTRRIAGATHCDFETPTDALCRMLCESAPRPVTSRNLVREEIIDWAVWATEMLLTGVDCQSALSKSASELAGPISADSATPSAKVATAPPSTDLSLCLATRKKARL